jgi:hypothetical protein
MSDTNKEPEVVEAPRLRYLNYPALDKEEVIGRDWPKMLRFEKDPLFRAKVWNEEQEKDARKKYGPAPKEVKAPANYVNPDDAPPPAEPDGTIFYPKMLRFPTGKLDPETQTPILERVTVHSEEEEAAVRAKHGEKPAKRKTSDEDRKEAVAKHVVGKDDQA